MLVKNENYLPILNFLRGVASIGVCTVHTAYLLNFHSYPISKLLDFGMLGVPVFFIISGFVVPYSLWNSKYKIADFFKFIIKRLVRINPPFVIIIMICLLLGYPFNFSKIFSNLFYLVPFSNQTWYQDIFWTLGIEFQFYILIGICFRFIKEGNIYLLTIILFILSTSGYFLPIKNEYQFIFIHYHSFRLSVLKGIAGKQPLL